jgi:hypothetical protein
MFVPQTVAQTTLAVRGPAASGELVLNASPGCPLADPLCGFRRDTTALVYDAAGLHDIFRVVDGVGNTLQVQRKGGTTTHTDYEPDTTSVAELKNIVYYLKADTAAGTYQLMAHDGGNGSDAPVVDHLVALEFEYFGDTTPPRLNGKALSETPGPWTTYGPAPPALDKQIPTGGYPSGENCAFQVDAATGTQVPRLTALPGAPNSDVPLSAAALTDGPWCPDAASPNRWDADLLRIRRIRVRLRVQSADQALRGPAGVLFSHGGTSTGGQRWLPDREVQLEIAPRNLDLGR